MQWKEFDRLIEAALLEDGARRDVTTDALIPAGMRCRAEMTAKETGIICGLPLAARLCRAFDRRLRFRPCCEDGEEVERGTVVATVSGPAASVLKVERTMLNFVQHLSGIATLTRRYVDAVAGTGAQILDTRKTTPGWRLLEKYAVRCGGGSNHRMGLSDQVLIKDNHLSLRREAGGAGGIADAVRAARKASRRLLVEVEVQSLQELADALPAEPDIILLDNMTPRQVREGAALVRQRCAGGRRPLLEASGGINLGNVRAYAKAGADRISIGALTHSAPALDVSLEIE